MGRILVQNRRPVVPNDATMVVTDAALTSWFGFSDTTTESMLIGFWTKPRVRNASYQNSIYKGGYQSIGVQVGIQGPNRVFYSQLNKSGVSTSSNETNNVVFGWSHQLVIIKRNGELTSYRNGRLFSIKTIPGFSSGEHWASSSNLGVRNLSQLATCSAIFASTNDPTKTLITPEEVRAMYETGAIPNDIIYWPMDEGSGSGAGTCKAYVNGVNVPALDGSLSADSWVADSPFN